MSVKGFCLVLRIFCLMYKWELLRQSKNVRVIILYSIYMAFIKKKIYVVKYIIEIRTQKYRWSGVHGLMEREKAGWLDRSFHPISLKFGLSKKHFSCYISNLLNSTA